MNYLEIFQSNLKFIDYHLKDKLDADILASKAGFSTYHFCRVFRYYIGYSPMEYVRHRRLLFAAMELSSTKSIIEIALEYGFETHSGFSKAFKKYFSVSPERYRVHAKAKYPTLPCLVKMKKYAGGIIMEPKFVTKPTIKIVGYGIKTTDTEGENSRSIPKFWNDYMTDGRMEKLHKESFIKNHSEYGACFPEDPETGEFEYVIGVEPKENSTIPDEYIVRDLPAATYAVFSTPPSNRENFTSNIQGVWQFIFNEWFPNSGYEYAEGCSDFELYDERCMSNDKKVCDIYIPVKAK